LVVKVGLISHYMQRDSAGGKPAHHVDLRLRSGSLCERNYPGGGAAWWRQGVTTPPGAQLNGLERPRNDPFPKRPARQQQLDTLTFEGGQSRAQSRSTPERSLPGQPAPAGPGGRAAGVQGQAQLRRFCLMVLSFSAPRGCVNSAFSVAAAGWMKKLGTRWQRVPGVRKICGRRRQQPAGLSAMADPQGLSKHVG